MSSIIQVENLSKSFTIHHEGKERYTALRDVMANKAKKIFSFPKALRPTTGASDEEFWALKDVSFNIEQGDRVGIIGRNGAGKSTLLKILSRITEPTSGRIRIRGRVASLLEVGTGFHPELTGRENIFLNGAILGMSRAEIKAKFDEIVDFAEVEKFLDTPVKRYSSGMYVRLAFAVAAHLEPEILVVDEVLAVGDAQFQKKCLGKMEDVSRNEGRTVLFVSHNIGAVEKLCCKGIYLKSGQLELADGIDRAIMQYLSEATLDSTKYSGEKVIKEAVLSLSANDNGKSNINIEVHFASNTYIRNAVLGIIIKDHIDIPLVGINNKQYQNHRLHTKDINKGVIAVDINDLCLAPGSYKIDLFLGDSLVDLDAVENALSFSIENAGFQRTTTPIDLRLNRILVENADWTLKYN